MSAEFLLAADFIDHVHAGNAGQHEIQDDELRPERAHDFQAGLAVRRDLGRVAIHRQLVAIDIGDDLVVLDDQNFLHAGLKLLTTAARSGWVLKKSWTRPYSCRAAWQIFSAPGNAPDAPSFSSSRNFGTRCVMPSVALAPAQLCATRRTSSALPSPMAVSICANCLCVCLRNISTSSRKLSAFPSVRSFMRSMSTGGSALALAVGAAVSDLASGMILPPQRSTMSRTSLGRTGLAR